MSIDSNPSQSFAHETASSSGLQDIERITVKIVDHWNGMSSSCFVVKLRLFIVSHLDEAQYHGYPDAAVSLSRGDTRCEMGNERGYMKCRMCSESCTNTPAYRSIDRLMLQVFELIPRGEYSDPGITRTMTTLCTS